MVFMMNYKSWFVHSVTSMGIARGSLRYGVLGNDLRSCAAVVFLILIGGLNVFHFHHPHHLEHRHIKVTDKFVLPKAATVPPRLTAVSNQLPGDTPNEPVNQMMKASEKPRQGSEIHAKDTEGTPTAEAYALIVMGEPYARVTEAAVASIRLFGSTRDVIVLLWNVSDAAKARLEKLATMVLALVFIVFYD